MNECTIYSPDYIVYKFKDNVFKVVRFNSNLKPLKIDKKESQSYDCKLNPSLSRSKKLIFELALCNEWDYFATLTFDPKKHDSYNLSDVWQTFYEWVRYYKKKYVKEFFYVFVPERHKSGRWHLHGLVKTDICLETFYHFAKTHNCPDYLIKNGYYTWKDFHDKFGYCSFSKIKHPVATCFYMTKYITKDTASLVDELGKRLFYSSHGLKKPSKHIEFYGKSTELDSVLTNHYEHCSVGMTKVNDNMDWTIGLDGLEFSSLWDNVEDTTDDSAHDSVVDSMYQYYFEI